MKGLLDKNGQWYGRVLLVIVFGLVFYLGLGPLLDSTKGISRHPESTGTYIIFGKIIILCIIIWGIWRLLCSKPTSGDNESSDNHDSKGGDVK